MSIKLEAGQWYRTLANQIVKCIHVHPDRGYLLVFKDGSCGYYPPDQAKEHLPDCTGFDWVAPPKAPKYRPFANAEEFKPHRDKWWRWKSDIFLQPPAKYSHTSHGMNGFPFMFDKAEFEDGTPFGVRVDD